MILAASALCRLPPVLAHEATLAGKKVYGLVLFRSWKIQLVEITRRKYPAREKTASQHNQGLSGIP